MNDREQPILITGAAGFIGSAVAERLLADGHSVVGIDNLNDYYDPVLKEARLTRVEQSGHAKEWQFKCMDISDKSSVDQLFAKYQPKAVIHLAAQAGVRYSFENPESYCNSNIIGFNNLLNSFFVQEIL